MQVVVQLGVHGRGYRVMHCAHKERVAIRRSLGGNAGSQRTAGAAAVVNDHLLAGEFGELGRQRSRKSIGAAAGRERHDHVDRLARPAGLRLYPQRQGCSASCGSTQHIATACIDLELAHKKSPVMLCLIACRRHG